MKNDFEQLLFAAENLRDMFYFLSDSNKVNSALYKEAKKSVGILSREIKAKSKEFQNDIMSDYGFVFTFSIEIPDREVLVFNKIPLEEEIAKIESFIERLKVFVDSKK